MEENEEGYAENEEGYAEGEVCRWCGRPAKHVLYDGIEAKALVVGFVCDEHFVMEAEVERKVEREIEENDAENDA